MTAIGKLLVFLNLFVSVVLISWAVSLYVNRLDWLDGKTEDGKKIPGQISRLKSEIDEETKKIVQATSSYGSREKRLAVLEMEQNYRHNFFEVQLTRARKGEVKGEDGPFKTRDTLKGGPLLTLLPEKPLRSLSDVDTPGKTVTFQPDSTPGKAVPLRGTEELSNELQREMDATATAAKDIADLRKQFGTASDEIKEATKRIEAQQVILANLVEQEKYLGSAQINWDEELNTVLRRNAQLLRRLEVLGVKVETRRTATGRPLPASN